VSLLNQLASNLYLMLRRPPRQQYGALCYRLDAMAGLQVLLLTSRETRRWVVPKGWPMKGKKAHAVAEREAYEEAGVRGKADKEPFGYFAYLKKLKSGVQVPVRVQVHALRVDEMMAEFPEKNSRTLAWTSCAEAALRVNEPELRALFTAFEKQMTPEPAQDKLRVAGR
jgi:8-oxo-dGTP pyrophosphatase MutT (NUDIX family)